MMLVLVTPQIFCMVGMFRILKIGI